SRLAPAPAVSLRRRGVDHARPVSRHGPTTCPRHRHPGRGQYPRRAGQCSTGRTLHAPRTVLSEGKSAMSPSTLRSALAFSVLINLGVLAALGWQKLASDGLPMPSGAQTTLSRELQLSPGQLQRWHDAEAPFLALLHASGADIQKHRDELIQAIFSGDVDR